MRVLEDRVSPSPTPPLRSSQSLHREPGGGQQSSWGMKPPYIVLVLLCIVLVRLWMIGEHYNSKAGLTQINASEELSLRVAEVASVLGTLKEKIDKDNTVDDLTQRVNSLNTIIGGLNDKLDAALAVQAQTQIIQTQAPQIQTDKWEGVVVIVELSRRCSGIAATIHNMLGNLPDRWGAQIFHGEMNRQFLNDHRNLQDLVKAKKLVLTEIKWDYNDGYSVGGPRGSYNQVLTSAQLWQEAKADKILIAQADTRICSNSIHRIEEFLRYDYIGAPWPDFCALGISQTLQQKGWPLRISVGNGGLSLRSRHAMLAAVEHRNEIMQALIENGTPDFQRLAEDIFFSFGLEFLTRTKEGHSYVMADKNTAATFAIENVDGPIMAANGGDFFGVHQAPSGLASLTAVNWIGQAQRSCPDILPILHKCACDDCNLH